VPTAGHSPHLLAQIDRTEAIETLVASFYSRPQTPAGDDGPITISLLSSDVRGSRGTVHNTPSEESDLPPADPHPRHRPRRPNGESRN
jgi:hypothetical protein